MAIRIFLNDDARIVLILMNELLNHKNVSRVVGGCELMSNHSESNLVYKVLLVYLMI